QKERLEQYLHNGEQIDILLLATNEFQQMDEFTHIESILYLLEKNAEVEENAASALFKYQPLSQLVTQVLAFHYERGGTKEKKKMHVNGETNVISVFSASGGAGKTTTAFHMANEMKQNG